MFECGCGSCEFPRYANMDSGQAAQLAGLPKKSMQYAWPTCDPEHPIKELICLIPIGRITCTRCNEDFGVDDTFANRAKVFLPRHPDNNNTTIVSGGVMCKPCILKLKDEVGGSLRVHYNCEWHHVVVRQSCITNVVCDIVVTPDDVKSAAYMQRNNAAYNDDTMFTAFMQRNHVAYESHVMRNVRQMLMCCRRNNIEGMADIMRGPVMALSRRAETAER